MRRPTRAEYPLIAIMLLACAPACVPVVVSLARAASDPDAWSDIPTSPARWVLLARSLWMAGLIAGLATLLAIPMAQVLRRSGARLAALLLAPVWMPAWLVYAGLNLARAPDTWLGGAIMDLALPDHRWAIVLLGQTVALGSLVLWSTPIAALVLTFRADPEASAADELLRTERLAWHRRIITRVRLHRAAWLTAFGSVFLLTVGSSVPLHLAQVETDAIVMWRAISERTPDRWGGVWLAAWPQLLIALIGSAWFVRRVTAGARPGESVTPAPDRRVSVPTFIAAWTVWSLAALLPAALMLWSLDSLASLPRWFELNRDALLGSLRIAALAGLVAGVASVTIAAAGASERATTRVIAWVLAGGCVFGMLAPGVLIGAAIARLGLDAGVAGVVAAAARTLFIAGIAGVALASAESPESRAMRSLDARGDAFGWLIVHPRRAGRLLVGVWLAAMLVALHEIEAATIVRPPGTGNLPQQMLSDLHYARLEQLSAGGVVIGALGIAMGVAASIVLSLRIRQPGVPRAVPPQI